MIVQLVSTGDELNLQYTPPPAPLQIVFAEMMQLVSTGEEPKLQLTPPPYSAEFPEIVQLVSTGEEHSTHGVEGAFFRLEPLTLDSDKKPLSGIFYAEPSGSYVHVRDQLGLPEPLVDPLIAAIKKKMQDR